MNLFDPNLTLNPYLVTESESDNGSHALFEMEIARVEPLVQITSELMVIGGGTNSIDLVFIPIIELVKKKDGSKIRTVKMDSIQPRLRLTRTFSRFHMIVKEESVAIVHAHSNTGDFEIFYLT